MATQMKKQSLWQQYKTPILLLGGIAAGSVLGIVSPGLGQTLKPVGDIFLNLLFTIVVPLVFVSIACAVGSMANMNRLGKILGGTVATFLATGGFGGVGIREGRLHIAPHLHAQWSRLRFPLSWQGTRLTVTVTDQKVTVENRGDRAAEVWLCEKPVTIQGGERYEQTL